MSIWGDHLSQCSQDQALHRANHSASVTNTCCNVFYPAQAAQGQEPVKPQTLAGCHPPPLSALAGASPYLGARDGRRLSPKVQTSAQGEASPCPVGWRVHVYAYMIYDACRFLCESVLRPWSTSHCYRRPFSPFLVFFPFCSILLLFSFWPYTLPPPPYNLPPSTRRL